MCGIAGLICRKPDRKTVEEMVNSISRRGPDDSGIYIDSDAALGFKRLSIIDLSKHGHQPMCDKDKKIYIILNGEIYNYVELRKDLGKKYSFVSKSDTEVLLYAYKEYGKDCLKHLNGMFAFAIWDVEKKELFVARDRLGIKPFYYYKDDEKFIFGSEIKALLKAGIKREPNDKVIYDYLIYGYYDHTNETFFSNVFKLPQGCYGIYANKEFKIERYWDLSKEIKAKDSKSIEESGEEFKKMFNDSVKLRLRSDVPIGVNLSGGLDSPTIVHFVNQQLKNTGRLNTFTMCFNDPKYDERGFVEEIVKEMDCKSHYLYFEPNEVIKYMDDSITAQDEPYGGVQTISYLRLMHLAKFKEKTTVLLEGQGGDELFAGYEKFRGAFYKDLMKNLQFFTFLKEIYNYKKVKNISYWECIKSIKSAIKAQKGGTTQDAVKSTNIRCVNKEFLDKFRNRKLSFDKPFKSELVNQQYQDLMYTKLPRVLRFNDHMAMFHSAEVRFPFLDHRIVEWAFALKNDKKISKGRSKYLIRNTMKGLLPKIIYEKPKQAVVTPQIDWFQNELKEYLLNIITSDSFKKRKYFNHDAVIEEFEKFQSEENPKNSFFIWQWIMLELWMRKYIDLEKF